MRASPRLFCLDTVLIDVVLTVAQLPPRAGDVRALDQLITTGGGFNAMSAAARHHMPVTYAGRMGSGPFAAVAAVALEREGIALPDCDQRRSRHRHLCRARGTRWRALLCYNDGRREHIAINRFG